MQGMSSLVNGNKSDTLGGDTDGGNGRGIDFTLGEGLPNGQPAQFPPLVGILLDMPAGRFDQWVLDIGHPQYVSPWRKTAGLDGGGANIKSEQDFLHLDNSLQEGLDASGMPS